MLLEYKIKTSDFKPLGLKTANRQHSQVLLVAYMRELHVCCDGTDICDSGTSLSTFWRLWLGHVSVFSTSIWWNNLMIDKK